MVADAQQTNKHISDEYLSISKALVKVPETSSEMVTQVKGFPFKERLHLNEQDSWPYRSSYDTRWAIANTSLK